MSEERIIIEYAIKSKELANVIKSHSSLEMNDYDETEDSELEMESFLDADYDLTIYAYNDIVIGSLIDEKYDENWSGWRPTKPTPKGSNPLKWFLDVICHADYSNKLSEEGKAYIKENINSIQRSIQKYKVIHAECLPYGESTIDYETYDGSEYTSYRMTTDIWHDMWDKHNRKEAEQIFEKYRLAMDDYSLDGVIAADMFSDIYSKPICIELLKQFGEKNSFDKIIGDEEVALSKEIEGLLKDLDKWIVQPDIIDFEWKKVGLSAYSSSKLKPFTDWGERLKMQYFVESSLLQLGAKYSYSDIGVTIDTSILIGNYQDYSTDYAVCKYYNINELEKVTFVHDGEPIRKRMLTDKDYNIGQLAVYKKYLEEFIDTFNTCNEKRLSKKRPIPAIALVYENEFFSYLLRLDKDPQYHQERQKIAKELVENSPYVDGDQHRIDRIYKAKPKGRDFDL